jgi:hypothetical protein
MRRSDCVLVVQYCVAVTTDTLRATKVLVERNLRYRLFVDAHSEHKGTCRDSLDVVNHRTVSQGF